MSRWEDAPLVDESSPSTQGKWASAPIVEDEPVKKTNRSISGALARGTEGVATGLGAAVGELGHYIGGGKVFPKMMAKLATYLHDDNYQPGVEDLKDDKASLGTRAAGLGRALVEGVPTMVPAAAAGAVSGGTLTPLMLGTLGAGNAAQRIRADEHVAPDQNLSPLQLARVGTTGLVDGALGATGVGAAVNTPAKTLAQSLLNVGKAGATNAKLAAAQTVADDLLAHRGPSLSDTAANALVGGAGGMAARAAMGVPEAAANHVQNTRWGDVDPAIRGQVASALLRHEPTEDNAGQVTKAVRQELADRGETIARGGLKGTHSIDAIVNGANDLNLVDTYKRVNTDLDRGLTLDPADIETLRNARVTDPDQIAALSRYGIGDRIPDEWMNNLLARDQLNRVAQSGVQSGNAIRGGLHATDIGKSVDRLSNLFGAGSGLAALGHVAGLPFPFSQVALGLGVTGTLGKLGIHGIDRGLGLNDPVGRYARQFAESPDVVSAPIQRVMSEPPASPEGPPPAPEAPTPPPIPPEPPPLPTPGELKMDAMIRAKYGKLPGPALGEDISVEPQRPTPPGADMEWRAPPPAAEPSAKSLAAIDALVARKTKQSTEVPVSDAFSAARAATLAKRSSLSTSRDRLTPKASQEPLQPRREAPQPKQEAPKESPMQEAVKPKIHTRKVGRGQHEVSVDESKIRSHLPNGEKDVDSFFNGVNERTLQKENFIDAAKNTIPASEHQKLDALLPKLMEHGVGMNLGRERFHAVVNKMKISAKRKADLKELFNHSEFGLNKSKYWGK